MKRWIRRVSVIGLVGSIAIGAAGCLMHYMMPEVQPPDASEFGMGPRASAAGLYRATLVSEDALKERALQTVRIAVVNSAGVPVEGARIEIDGGMPAHGHGLPTRPRVTRELSGGEYVVEGLRFNMAGWWVLAFDVDGAAGRDSITFNLDL